MANVMVEEIDLCASLFAYLTYSNLLWILFSNKSGRTTPLFVCVFFFMGLNDS